MSFNGIQIFRFFDRRHCSLPLEILTDVSMLKWFNNFYKIITLFSHVGILKFFATGYITEDGTVLRYVFNFHIQAVLLLPFSSLLVFV